MLEKRIRRFGLPLPEEYVEVIDKRKAQLSKKYKRRVTRSVAIRRIIFEWCKKMSEEDPEIAEACEKLIASLYLRHKEKSEAKTDQKAEHEAVEAASTS